MAKNCAFGNGQPLSEAIRMLEQASGWNISYQDQDLEGLRVEHSAQAMDAPALLEILLKDQLLTYEVISQGFVVLVGGAPTPSSEYRSVARC